MADVVIQAEDLEKRYIIGHRAEQGGYVTLREVMMRNVRNLWQKTRDVVRGNPIIHGHTREEVWALRDVSFEIRRGEAVGIIGRNGAGKSTLLKILSRITEPSAGRVTIKGRVASLLEVGTGFHPELTGRENIYLNGAILGMTRQEIRARFDEIVAFAETEKFLDTPVKHYSSGMYVRLAFAVAAHLEPEILLVDEVLAVGDLSFQKKCLFKMGDVVRQGRTVLLVSHNLAAVENLCDRGMVLSEGRASYIGSQKIAIVEYMKSSDMNKGGISLRERTDRIGSGGVRVTKIEIRDRSGEVIDVVSSGQDFEVHFSFEASPSVVGRRVVVSLMWKTLWGIPVFLHHNRMTADELGALPGKGTFVCELRQLPLVPSTYNIGYSVREEHGDYLDSIDSVLRLTVTEGDFFGSGELPPSSHGICLVHGRWRIETAQPPAAGECG